MHNSFSTQRVRLTRRKIDISFRGQSENTCWCDSAWALALYEQELLIMSLYYGHYVGWGLTTSDTEFSHGQRSVHGALMPKITNRIIDMFTNIFSICMIFVSNRIHPLYTGKTEFKTKTQIVKQDDKSQSLVVVCGRPPMVKRQRVGLQNSVFVIIGRGVHLCEPLVRYSFVKTASTSKCCLVIQKIPLWR